jgi:hypothetical protein
MSKNPFSNKENLNLINKNDIYISQKQFINTDLNNKEDQSTKKKIEEKIKNLNINSQNQKENNLYQLLAKRKKVTKGNNTINPTIIFLHQKTKEPIEFILYKDKNVYCANPYQEKIIPMINDEDVLSDNELIAKSTNILFNNLNKGIEDFINGNIEE